ncbi:host attachment family protein [Rhizobiaceae bacterium n13]|uniref:Host attachment family protein n=1 Tax=Ferirhizobium litorale TaxID=2927786 RepID=A0AAE3QCB4_9HYPH|nr:host attachment family protein [Fererhizobium litorale]MDI7861206.1 host attachment family protein [Fererhizobium litorale]MDI7921353.1 host attachment family protein [Fererhizobium litorale]
MLKFPKNSWVVVCDGAKAQILQNVGLALEPRLRLEESLEQPDEKNTELATDRPGRAFQSFGTKRSAMEETDWHEEAEKEFLKQVAAKLETLVRDKEASHIVVVAPPKALGYLRPHFTSEVRAAVQAELAKDIAKLTPPEIEKHLVAWASA